LIEQGDAAAVLQTYLKSSGSDAVVDLRSRKDRQGNGAVRFTEFSVLNSKGEELGNAQSGEHLILRFAFEPQSDRAIQKLHLAIGIDDEFGGRIAHLSNEVTNEIFDNVNNNHRYIDIHIPRFPLRSGSYSFTLFSTVNGEIADYLQNAGSIFVESGDFYKTGKLPPEGQGNFFIDHHFKLS
jgi:lipopolysaccharide transport system ATP-binding protein